MKPYSLAPQCCHQSNIHVECHTVNQLGIMKRQLVYTVTMCAILRVVSSAASPDGNAVEIQCREV